MEGQEFNFGEFEAGAIEGLRQGRSLMGEDGIFTPLLKRFLEAGLEGELSAHLSEVRQSKKKNRRNGHNKKEVRSSVGRFELETPRDRSGTFEPVLVPKRQTILTDQLEQKIISMYGRGMSYADISAHIEELYGFGLSAGELSLITDKVLPQLHGWQQRPLETMYVAIWLDAMFHKVRVDGKVVSRAMYSVVGLNLEGKKEILGIYLSENEGARFWLTVLQDLRQRGVEDVLFCCVDGLKGFPEAIAEVFPQALVQLCVVHMIRYSMRLIADKDTQEFMADLKAVYQASILSIAEENLRALEQKWGKKYPQSVATWTNNWQHIATYFDYSEQIRRMIYTTNTIESYHRQIRKITKSKAAFTSDNALLKVAFLAIQNMTKLWNQKLRSWKSVLNELIITFGDRINPHLKT